MLSTKPLHTLSRPSGDAARLKDIQLSWWLQHKKMFAEMQLTCYPVWVKHLIFQVLIKEIQLYDFFCILMRQDLNKIEMTLFLFFRFWVSRRDSYSTILFFFFKQRSGFLNYLRTRWSGSVGKYCLFGKKKAFTGFHVRVISGASGKNWSLLTLYLAGYRGKYQQVWIKDREAL